MAQPLPDEHTIFDAARRIDDADARDLYVRQACGEDPRLRARVEVLLRAHEENSAFLLPPTHRLLAGLEEPLGEAPGSVIGPYTLVRQIGRGGMGVVFLAEQTEPIQRQVALKIIRPGMDTRQVVGRFEAERQALARMDHPNIAKIFDAGTTGTGRSYFVMELLQGVPITGYCDEQRLTPRQRLELFVGVCQGVQHAHSKGIIHRDIKPSNVLVALYDGRPVPKVIDFGIAKATGPQLSEHSIATEVGALIGTLEYMSPEQAEANDPGIDTRSDIYALGVLLYELLTGGVPFSRQRLQAVPLTEMLRIIREVEPPRPSARLSASETLPAITAARRTEPKKLVALVRGELDWIVMKCLDKGRDRRYETADGLARDIGRYLADEPVEASPPSTAYRLKKFLRRHWGPVLAAAIIFLLLVGGITGTTVGLKLASNRLAQVEAEKERTDVEAAIARAVDDFVQKDLLGQANLGNQANTAERNKDITVRQLLDRAAERMGDRFRGQERTEAAVRLTLGKAYYALGEYPKAEKHLERSHALLERQLGDKHPDTLVSMNSLGLVCRARGRYNEARTLLEKVVEGLRINLGADHHETLQCMHNLGIVYRDLSRYDDAESLFTQVLEAQRARGDADHPSTLLVLNHIALLHMSRGRFNEAEPLLKEVVSRFRVALRPDHPFTLICTNNLASCYMELRRYDEAERLYRQVLKEQLAKLPPNHPDTLFSMNFVGLVLNARKRPEEAEPLLRQVLEARRKILDADHPDTLTSLSNLAIVLQDLHKDGEAEDLFKQALAGRRTKLGAEDPDTLRSMNNLGQLYKDLSRYAEAEPLFRKAVTGAKKKLSLNHPQTHHYINNLADLCSKQAKPALAEPELRELADFLGKKRGLDSPVYANQVRRLAQNLLEQNKHAEAETAARDVLTVLSRKEPDAWTTFHTRSLLGGALLGQKKYADAEPLLEQGYNGMKEREAKLPKDGKVYLTQALERLLQLHDARGNKVEAARLRKELEARKPGQKR